MKQNEFRELVNELRDIAKKYAETDQLRDRIAHCLAARLGHPVPDIVPRTPVLDRIDERLAADVLTGTATHEVLLVAKGEILRLMGETEALKRQEPFDAEDPRFREAFEAAVAAGNYPAARQGDGYRSPVTQAAWSIAFSTVNRLKLYSAPVPQVPSVPDEHAAFSVFFCSEMKLPANADLTQYDEAWLPWRAWRTRAALAAAPQPERWKPTEQDRAAIRAALDQRAPIAELPTGSVAFLSYGDEPDYSQLDCPACGGSGHVGDTRAGAVLDVLAERRRQIEVEDWTPEHDDEHANGEMSLAAGLYAISAGFATKYLNGETKTCPVPDGWPWAEAWWKPVNARHDLVKSVALGLAEIERMDRAERSAGDERGAS